MEHQQKLKPEYSNIGEGDKLIALHYFNNRCCYCQRELTRDFGFPNSLEMEHYISVNQQMLSEDEIIDGSVQNRVPSCRTCNRKKSDTHPEIWIRQTFANADEIIEKIEMFFAQQEEFLFK